jgi:DNA-3-methyladenine glycosylase I
LTFPALKYVLAGFPIAFLAVQKEFGSFDKYIWSFKTSRPEAMSCDLKKRGFRFVGSTICYAFMQAVGKVNDHTTDFFEFQILVPAVFYT